MAFELRGELEPKKKLLFQVAGVILVILVWWLVSAMGWISKGILPAPLDVLASFKGLHFDDALVRNALLSIWRNLQGYFWAMAISIPIGFLVGLIPAVRGLFGKQVDVMRFIPLTILTGMFVTWFGTGEAMKVSFLAFGIIVYLLPVVIQRIDDVDKVYLQTVYTLGATKWQTIKTVFWPAVVSKISDDIRVLVAISWTYIIVAEGYNRTGGIGDLRWKVARQGYIDKSFAILIVIVLIGYFQDRLFVFLDKFFFPHKYVNR